MYVLVLNCGSSSVKYKLFDMAQKTVIAQGGAEKVGLQGSFLKLTTSDGNKVIVEHDMPNHNEAISFILYNLTGGKYKAIDSLEAIHAVGHRVVHGGETFNQSVRIDKQVLQTIDACSDMAPLHNPANLAGIRTIAQLLPHVPQVAVFDTAFHQTMPEKAYLYGLPYSLYEKYKVRRYGFHGTSHRYVSQHACAFLQRPADGMRMITCHIGNGGSITAIKDGKSIDTSMGFTPLEGLLMGTRCGDIDAGAVTYLMEKEALDAAGISTLLNKKSGVLGVSGISSDMRDLEAAALQHDPNALRALDLYEYKIAKYIGAYTVALGGLDVLVFTGGVGENQTGMRKAICQYLAFMGVKIDEGTNQQRGKDCVISTPDSAVTVVVIPTDEEFMIASDTLAVIG